MITFLLTSFLLCKNYGQTLQGDYNSPYKKPDFTQITTLLSLFLQQPSDSALSILKSKKCLEGEVKALLYEFSRYNLSASPHQTDGWTDFAQAERSFMAMIYTGLGICNLAQQFPELKEKGRKQVLWLLQAIQTSAISGFMTPHFGQPFSSQPLEQTSVLIHGHFLYLALYYRNAFQAEDIDPIIHKIAEALQRDFLKNPVLASYSNMCYLSDNLPALAALRNYDLAFEKTFSQKPVEAFLREVKTYYLDKYSGLMCAYVNVISKQQASKPSGAGMMYALIFLSELDSSFAHEQWQKAKNFMIRDCAQLIQANEQTTQFTMLSGNIGQGLIVCLEHPDRPGITDAERNAANGDSGPVFLGAGTTASGLAVTAAYKMSDEHIAFGLEKLAIRMGNPAWFGDKLYYINMIHPVGQAVIFFGKTMNRSF